MNIAPPPSALPAATEPFDASVACRTMASPRPLTRASRGRSGSDRSGRTHVGRPRRRSPVRGHEPRTSRLVRSFYFLPARAPLDGVVDEVLMARSVCSRQFARTTDGSIRVTNRGPAPAPLRPALSTAASTSWSNGEVLDHRCDLRAPGQVDECRDQCRQLLELSDHVVEQPRSPSGGMASLRLSTSMLVRTDVIGVGARGKHRPPAASVRRSTTPTLAASC